MEITTKTTTPIFFTLLPTPLVRPILTDLSRPLYECLDCGSLVDPISRRLAPAGTHGAMSMTTSKSTCSAPSAQWEPAAGSPSPG